MWKKWKLSLIALMALLFLSACGAPKLPDKSKIAKDLQDYYQTETERAYLVDSVEFTKQDYSKEDKSAEIVCTVVASPDDRTFCRTDIWHMTYTYSEKNWLMDDATCVETSYELLSDLNEPSVVLFLSQKVGQKVKIDTLTTDRSGKSAAAAYSYEGKSADFGEYGNITISASGDAFFSWDPSIGWALDRCELNESTSYLCNMACHVDSENITLLGSREINLGFDVAISDNSVVIDHISYQGDIRALGDLTISNPQFQAGDNGETAIISFDYIRDVSDIRNNKNYRAIPAYEVFYQTATGTGELQLRTNDSGESYGKLFLSDFMAEEGNAWSDVSPLVTLSSLA